MKYIDSSAFVKYYALEELEKGNAFIKELINKAKQGEETIFSSLLLIGEVVSIFDKWYRRHWITKEELQDQLFLFVEDIKELTDNGGLIIEPLDSFLLLLSLNLITKYHLSVGDALHLYTAELYLPLSEQFISADRNLNLAAQAEGFTVINPEEA